MINRIEQIEEIVNHLKEAVTTQRSIKFHSLDSEERCSVTFYDDQDFKLIANFIPSETDRKKMDETLAWLTCLDILERRVVLLRAGGSSWRQICWELSSSRDVAWKIYTSACEKIRQHVYKEEDNHVS